jgi:DNA helicase-2/ATP-dependent DNA helicase PcrA
MLRLYSAFNDRDEVEFVINRIRTWAEQGGQRQEVAILYRSNAQSRVFEEALIQAGLPYRVYGGQRFFERAEIKDALAYLRLLANLTTTAPSSASSTCRRAASARAPSICCASRPRATGSSLWQAAAHGAAPAGAAGAGAGAAAPLRGADRAPARRRSGTDADARTCRG